MMMKVEEDYKVCLCADYFCQSPQKSNKVCLRIVPAVVKIVFETCTRSVGMELKPTTI